ncbi:MAG: histidine phosphatase family protein, partial [Planctomycetota bacterium]
MMLVRHGETPANLEGVWHGSIDSPLTDRGRVQVDRVARFLGESFADSSAVYSSHLQRAHDTARAIAAGLGLETQVDEDLGEYNLGCWEGKTYRELFEEHDLWHHMKHDPDFAPHGGETPRQVAERFTGALRRIAARHAG